MSYFLSIRKAWTGKLSLNRFTTTTWYRIGKRAQTAVCVALMSRFIERYSLLVSIFGSIAILAGSCGGGEPTPQSRPEVLSRPTTALQPHPQPVPTQTLSPRSGVKQPGLSLSPTASPDTSPALHPDAAEGPLGFGREATQEEIRAWDIDVRPDGEGLPPGRGTVARGAEIYADKCAVCHGKEGEGVPGASGALVLPYDLSQSWPQFPRTVGNYWPYATTLYDYINRAMPANAPGSLKPDEIYSLIAWLLYENRIIESGDVISNDTLPLVKMPAAGRFIAAPGVTSE
jgi:mono/diheme cytochrome c family protein